MLFDILHSYNIKHIVQLPDIESMIYIYIYIKNKIEEKVYYR